MADETYIFAYGTLRPPRAGTLLEDSRYYPQLEGHLLESRPAALPRAALYDLGTYPAARPGTHMIQGDLLRVTPDALAIVDRIEGHPVFYYRELVSVDCGGEQLEAWVYWAPEGLEKAGVAIPNGDWFDRPGRATAAVLPPAPSPIIHPGEDAALRAQFLRLAEAEAVWLTTVRPDGRPHSTPVWLGWHHGRIYVVAKPSAVKTANIEENSGVVLTLPDPMSALVVEGRATIVPAMRQTVRPVFLEKYNWDIDSDPEYRSVIEITPYKLLAWGSKGQGRWTGPAIFAIR
jgi:gamma-glutamylcyclotransferase (GGCT)/AIG2-like uncharacterized protein YtfP